jgi:antitoxin ParD1/3/4
MIAPKEISDGHDEHLAPRPDEGMGRTKVATGRYANASDYMRDLVRKDQLHVDAVAKLQKIVDDALASGISDKSVDEIFADARRKAIKAVKGKDAAA